jgi:hypothetical protein
MIHAPQYVLSIVEGSELTMDLARKELYQYLCELFDEVSCGRAITMSVRILSAVHSTEETNFIYLDSLPRSCKERNCP